MISEKHTGSEQYTASDKSTASEKNTAVARAGRTHGAGPRGKSRAAVWAAAGVTAGALFGGLTPSAFAQFTQYKLYDLSGVSATEKATFATGISPNGQYILSQTVSTNASGTAIGRAMAASTVTTVPAPGTLLQAPGTFNNVFAQAVNNSGQIAGIANNGTGNIVSGSPYLWTTPAAVPSALTIPPQFASSAFNNSASIYGVNSAGDVYGQAGAGTPTGVIWHPQPGAFNPFEEFQNFSDGGKNSGANAVSADGWLAGQGTTGANQARSFAQTQDGSIYYEDISSSPNNLAFGVNNNGTVVGSSAGGLPFKWTPTGGPFGTLTTLSVLNNESGRGVAVNDSGTILVHTGTSSTAVSTAGVSDGNVAMQLSDLAGVAGARYYVTARSGSLRGAIANNGTVVGGSSFQGSTTDTRAVALVPIAGTSASQYTGTNSGTFSDPTRWNNGVPSGTNTLAVFSRTILAASTITVTNPLLIQGFTFNSGSNSTTPTYGYTVTSTGAGTVTLQSTVADAPAQIVGVTGSHTVATPITFASDVQIASAFGQTISLTGAISVANGASPVVAAGLVNFTAANTYATPTVIAGGTLRAADGTGLPTNSVLKLTGGVYEATGTFTRALGSSGANLVSWPATATGGFASGTAPLVVNVGGQPTPATLEWGTADFSPAALQFNPSAVTNTVTFSNPVNLNGTILGLNVGANTATFSGKLADGTAPGGITAGGPGTLVLSGSNTYTGPTRVTGGTLRIVGAGLSPGTSLTLVNGFIDASGTVANPPGSGAGQIQFLAGGTGPTGFNAFGGALTVNLGSAAQLTWGSATFDPFILGINSTTATAAQTFANPIDLNGATRTISVGANSGTLTGALTGPAGSNLTKAGAGTLILANTANTFPGLLTVQAGSVALTGTTTLASSVALTATNTSLNLAGLTNGGLSLAPTQTITLNVGAQLTGGTVTGSGTVALTFPASSGTFITASSSLTGSTTVTATGVISTNVAVLAGTNTYSGPTTVTLGVLRAAGLSLSPNSAITLNNGTLETNGTLTRSIGTGTGQLRVISTAPGSNTVAGFSAVGTAGTTPLTVSFGGTTTPATVNWGSADFNPGLLVLNNAAANNTLLFRNPIDLGGATRALRVVSAAQAVTLSGVLSNGGISKDGSGILILTATNTYAGGTAINGGFLRAIDGTNLPSGSALSLSAGGVFQTVGTLTRSNIAIPTTGTAGFDALSAVAGTPLTLAFGGVDTLKTIEWGGNDWNPGTVLLNNTAVANGPITVMNPLDLQNVNATLNVGTGANASAATTTYSGRIFSTLGTSNLTKSGSGVLVLTNANNGWNGALNVNAGRLVLAAGAGLTSNITVSGSGIFDGSAVANPYALVTGQTLTFVAGNGSGGTVIGNLTGSGTVGLQGTSLFGSSESSVTNGIGGSLNIAFVNGGSNSNFSGTISLTGALTTTGNTSVSGAANRLILKSALRPVVGTLAVTGTSNSASFAVTPSAAAYTRVGEFASISVANTDTVDVSATARGSVKASVLVTSALTVAPTGFVDLGNNDLIVRGGSLSSLRSLVSTWLTAKAAGTNVGLGSTVTTAATTLAVFPNAAADGVAYFDAYDGVSLTAADLIVKYTYVGDTDLDGLVTGRDLAATIEGLTTGKTGWQNGDFDYNGIVDAADLSKLLAVLNTPALPSLGNGLGDGDGPSGAVPEPTALAPLIAAAGLLTRRRRR